MRIFPVLWRLRFKPPSLPEKAIPSNGYEEKASSSTTARLRQRLRASCAFAAEGAALGLVCDPRRLVNMLPPGAAPSLAASARGLLRSSLRRASAASCPALRSSRRAQCIVSASAVPHGCAPLPFAPRGQYAGRGSAARPDTLPVCIPRYARPCSVCPAPCLAVCFRRVLRPAMCSHQTSARRQPPARTTAARLGPAACSAFSTGQRCSAEAARPARACRALCAFAAPVALVEWWINLSSLLPGSTACFLRRSLVGKHRNAVPVKGQDERQSRP